MWCILWRSNNETKIIGPFETAQQAALYTANELDKPLGMSSVIMSMTKP